MAKIFISYKYKDKYVRQKASYNYTDWLLECENGNYQTARDYVTYLMDEILIDHTNKAEKDNEDISHLTEEIIQKKLYNRIYDSTVTIILISKNMKESKAEKLQWIPREIAYSLREQQRNDRTSYANGMLAVILPDENNMYDYGVIKKECGVTSWQTGSFFKIISENMFNKLNKNVEFCALCNNYHHHETDHSYIHPVRWDDFIKDHNKYINHVLDLKDRLDDFKLLVKTLD